MLLAVDIGNSQTVLGLVEEQEENPRAVWRLSSDRNRTADDWFSAITPLLRREHVEPTEIDGVVISSVVPAITESMTRFCRSTFAGEPLLISADLDLGVRVMADHPHEVGTDRLANAAAAYARYGGPIIVVDLGTATKLEAIAADGAYLGGIIAPGLRTGLDALASRAARLYSVDLELPGNVIGTNTVAAVQSGVVLGHLAMIEGLLDKIATHLGPPNHVILTGGHTAVFAEQTHVFTAVDQNLTLRGLIQLFKRNRRVVA